MKRYEQTGRRRAAGGNSHGSAPQTLFASELASPIAVRPLQMRLMAVAGTTAALQIAPSEGTLPAPGRWFPPARA